MGRIMKPKIPYAEITGDPKILLDHIIDTFMDNDPDLVAAVKVMGRVKTRTGLVELMDAGICWIQRDEDADIVTLHFADPPSAMH